MQKHILTTAFLVITALSNAQQSDISSLNNEMVHDTVKPKKTKTLEEVNVNGKQNRKPVTAVRSGLKSMDNPQSLQVIGGDVIQQQQSIRLSEVVKNANGVYVGSARGGAQESVWSRGYDMSANNIFKNGFRSNGGYMPEVASLEKVEILKGSSALLYGNVTPGGILNLVTKTPSFKSGGEVSMQVGSYSFYKPTFDFYGPLNSGIAYRLIGSYENSESFRDVVKRKRYYINPSVLFKATEKTDILLQSDVLYDEWTPDFGTGAIDKTLVDIPRNTYLGATWSNGVTKQVSLSSLIRHSFNDNWKLSGNLSFQNYSRASEGTDRIQPAANGTLVRPLGKTKNTELISGQQVALQGTFSTGKIKHQLYSGIDGDYAISNAYTYVFTKNGALVTNYDTVNIFNPATYQNEGPIPGNQNSKIVQTTTSRYGFFTQDLISITEKIKVLAGLRWSWQESQAKNYNYKLNVYQAANDPNPIEDPKRTDRAFSPKLGLVLQPTKTITVFGSYANSFSPNTGIDINGKTLAPSLIDQFETGVKTEFLKGLFATNVTLYLIDNNNLAQMASNLADGTVNSNSNIKTLSGETRSKGIEVDFTARPLEGLAINAGYSYNDMRYTKTNGLVGSFVEGDRLARTPNNTANLSFFYTVQKGFFKGVSLGSIANYIGDRIGGWNRDYVQLTPSSPITIRDREIPISGYTTVDASVGYTYKQISLLCKVSNITNELNYTVHENYSVNPIAPRQVMASLKYKF